MLEFKTASKYQALAFLGKFRDDDGTPKDGCCFCSHFDLWCDGPSFNIRREWTCSIRQILDIEHAQKCANAGNLQNSAETWTQVGRFLHERVSACYVFETSSKVLPDGLSFILNSAFFFFPAPSGHIHPVTGISVTRSYFMHVFKRPLEVLA